jgi:cytochrome P450
MMGSQDAAFDFRNSSITNGVQGLECPQARYTELAEKRVEYVDGVTNLFRWEDITRINRHPAVLGQGGSGVTLGSARPLIPNDIDGPIHARWRALLDPMFAPKVVARWEQSFRDLAGELLDRFPAAEKIELNSAYCTPLPSRMFLNILGAPQDDLAFFLEFKDGVLRPEGKTAEEVVSNSNKAGAKLNAYFATMLAQRRAEPEPRDDLIGALMSAELDGEPLTEEQITDILYVMMLAGLDTVTATLTLIFSWLARHPDVRARIVADPSLIPGAVEDIMRFETPVPAVNRHPQEDIDLGDGLIVRKGETLHCLVAAANVDAAAFPDPLTVDIERPRRTHIAYASGTHRCLGSHLARLELRVAVEELLRRHPDFELDAGDPPRYHNVVIRMATRLPVTFPARNGAQA